ncbi:MAG: carboxylesterase family protein [Planctomycetota bacterium]|jgi:predicted peptidase
MNQRSRIIGIALFSIGLAIVTCASVAGAADIKRLKAADNGSFKVSDGSTLLYALSEPEKLKQGERYPLVVFLHGAGGMSGKRKTDRGKDGGDQFFQTMTEECYFFMPQASAIWSGIGWGKTPYKMKEEPSRQMQQVIECIDWLLKEKAVDPDRIYVAGASMGSMGMWDLVCRRPKLFAAGIACCGGFDADQAAKIAHIKFRIFHGDKDPWVPIDGSQVMYDALKKAGADVEYHIYKGRDHFVWGPTFGNGKNLDWLFKQRRQKPPGGEK